MQRPRIPGAGIAGAEAAITLGSKIASFIPPTGPTAQSQTAGSIADAAARQGGAP
jgi:hypothetical protein